MNDTTDRTEHQSFWADLRGASFARNNPSTVALVDTREAPPVGIQFLVKGPEDLRKTLEAFLILRETMPHFKNIKVRPLR